MRDSLAFSGMFRAVSCIEQASLDGDKGIIEFAVIVSTTSPSCINSGVFNPTFLGTHFRDRTPR